MRFKRFIKIGILAAVILLAMFSAVNFSSAGNFLKDNVLDNISKDAQNVGVTAGYNLDSPDDKALILVQTVINIFLSIIGVLLLVYILYAGYNWLTAQGEEEKVTKAKDTLKRAIVGAIIIVAAYAISIFVMSGIEQGTLKGAGGGSPNIYQPGG
ncbi:MAG: hypothetical protein UU95_C0024G0021 [Parcubacteria group bacterium GW2011_GWC2_42_12]|uniref:Uncharacterized protein n=2 Tax=Candidatus Falkowiibacteriota TaxID=1752728 RepID=A0A1F5S9M3_9BACT|nr:MAG: hypothetical protein UU43_C0001G0110 [Candidatus Falkowbacteria bacterium GW2011_GWA2_41_14]KKS33714.1 MAG: hypothetical protein UU95_C0024G0021 [Parcubacteria group bacterium GW2011_GWC2_42_12]OGF23418.1 MAG: hypothetical protein A3D45_01960 [Candidatus Falkowbacteria bacterium RIFCSPHIGHO2_02_FULL_42_9]